MAGVLNVSFIRDLTIALKNTCFCSMKRTLSKSTNVDLVLVGRGHVMYELLSFIKKISKFSEPDGPGKISSLILSLLSLIKS